MLRGEMIGKHVLHKCFYLFMQKYTHQIIDLHLKSSELWEIAFSIGLSIAFHSTRVHACERRTQRRIVKGKVCKH